MTDSNSPVIQLRFTPEEMELLDFARMNVNAEGIRSMVLHRARSMARERVDAIARVSNKRGDRETL